MTIDGKLAVLVTKEKNGGCSVDDVKKAYADLEMEKTLGDVLKFLEDVFNNSCVSLPPALSAKMYRHIVCVRETLALARGDDQTEEKRK